MSSEPLEATIAIRLRRAGAPGTSPAAWIAAWTRSSTYFWTCGSMFAMVPLPLLLLAEVELHVAGGLGEAEVLVAGLLGPAGEVVLRARVGPEHLEDLA